MQLLTALQAIPFAGFVERLNDTSTFLSGRIIHVIMQ